MALDAVHDADVPHSVVACGVALVVGVALDGGAVIRVSFRQIGGVVGFPVVQVVASFSLFHGMPLLRLVGSVGSGHDEWCTNIGGFCGFALRGVGQRHAVHAVEDLLIAVIERDDLPLLAMAVINRGISHHLSIVGDVEDGGRPHIGNDMIESG